jgi:hypothetical protein
VTFGAIAELNFALRRRFTDDKMVRESTELYQDTIRRSPG